jgi:hypothetical protein
MIPTTTTQGEETMNTTTRSPSPAASRARRAWLVTLLATPAIVLALTGCTSGGPGAADSDSGTGGSTTDQPSTDAEFSAARDDYDRKLAECLRGQGLDVKDPQPGAGITEDSPEIQEAYPACAAEIGDPPSSAGLTLSPEDLDRLLDRATCLRDLGYDIKEPTVNDPGFIPADVTDEDFDTCQS